MKIIRMIVHTIALITMVAALAALSSVLLDALMMHQYKHIVGLLVLAWLLVTSGISVLERLS